MEDMSSLSESQQEELRRRRNDQFVGVLVIGLAAMAVLAIILYSFYVIRRDGLLM